MLLFLMFIIGFLVILFEAIRFGVKMMRLFCDWIEPLF